MSDPFKDRDGKPSQTRVVIWIVVAAIGLYLLGSGLVGILTPGS